MMTMNWAVASTATPAPLSDLWGARRVFVAGWTILIAGSVVAAAKGSAGTEIAGRAVQGVGAALIAPAAMTLLMVLFAGQPKELPKALAGRRLRRAARPGCSSAA